MLPPKAPHTPKGAAGIPPITPEAGGEVPSDLPKLAGRSGRGMESTPLVEARTAVGLAIPISARTPLAQFVAQCESQPVPELVCRCSVESDERSMAGAALFRGNEQGPDNVPAPWARIS